MTLLLEITTLLCIAAVIAVTCIFLLVLWKRTTAPLDHIPSLPTFPWLGSAPYLKRDPYELGLQMTQFMFNNGFVCVLWLSRWPIILSGLVEHAEVVLSTQKHLTKPIFYWFLHEWLGTGLLTAGGSKWKKRRRALTPSFHFAILKDFATVIQEEAEILIERLKHSADIGEVVDIQVPISLATLDVICQTAMGVTIHSQKDPSSEYVAAITTINSQLQLRQKSPWLWPDFIYRYTSHGRQWYKDLKIVHDFTANVTRKRILSRNDSTTDVQGPKHRAFLDTLLDLYDKGEIDVDGIREEVDTFMFEGHDTTASGISWTLYRIGKHPEAQRKLQKEVDAIACKKGDLIDRIRDSKYLDFVLKEALRMHPPVPLFARILDEDIVVNGNKISKGTSIGVAPMALHYNPAYWDEPYEFNPDRFGEEKFLNRHPYSYLPFSAGPRNCIGQRFAILEQKIILYHVILNFELKSLQSDDEIRFCYEIIHKSGNGILVQLKAR